MSAPGVLMLVVASTAMAAVPSTPFIGEPGSNGQIVHAGDVHMEAGGFSDPDGDSHACTDWQILTASGSEVLWEAPCVTGVLATHAHLGDGSFVNSYAGRTALEFATSYLLRARFQDSNGEVGAFAQRFFSTFPPSTPGGPVAWTPMEAGYRVEPVVGGLQLPVAVAFAPRASGRPKEPLLYIAELYGGIRVLTRGGALRTYASGLLNFDPTGHFPGSGEQGLAGIVVEPVSGDLIASVVYEDGDEHYPKVIRLHSEDGGLTAASVETLLDMPGEITSTSHQISNLTLGPDGKLYVHNGDGFASSTALDLDSFRGKILRVNLDGSAPSDNPFYDASDGITARDYVFAYGFRNPFGGAWRAANGAHYEVENGPRTDRVARITRGQSYGWNGSNSSMSTNALYTWTPSHAPVNIAFVQRPTFLGSGFPPEKMDRAYVTESGPTYTSGPQTLGKRVVEFSPGLDGELGGPARTLLEYTGDGKSTAAGLAAGPDGLYFTDLYRDQDAATPIDPGAQVLRIRHVGTYERCELDGRVLEVTVPKGERVRVVRLADGSIEVDDHSCGATVINLNRIEIRGARGAESVLLDLRGGHLGPGATSELRGRSELEVDIVLGAGRRDRLAIRRRGRAPVHAFKRGVRLDRADRDLDVRLRGVEVVR